MTVALEPTGSYVGHPDHADARSAAPRLGALHDTARLPGPC
jgi:hypothetical protein